MGNLFSGLEAFGLEKLKGVSIYGEEKKSDTDQSAKGKKAEIKEEDLIFDKKYECEACGKEFTSKTVRTGKVKLLSQDMDLRPRYQLIDSLKYDAVTCPHCGYSALSRYFMYMTSLQRRLIKENISVNFKGINTEGTIYTYGDAIARHKLALVNAIIKKGKSSEKAYICLKLAWLFRGKAESTPKERNDYEKTIEQLKKEENECIVNAYKGFTDAISKEYFPMCGMDENVTTYLLAELGRRCKKYEEALRLVSKVITAKNASEKLKERARKVRDLIKAEKP